MSGDNLLFESLVEAFCDTIGLGKIVALAHSFDASGPIIFSRIIFFHFGFIPNLALK
jgi:hypothetical protein